MTKRNLTLGSASGKLGSVVYMRRRGQQIARLLVPAPHDPKTLAQCGVRAKFANYVNLWRQLRPIVGITWRGVSRYGSPENAFYKHNAGLMPAISIHWSRAGVALPNQGLVTYGSLPINFAYEWNQGKQVNNESEWPGVYFLYSSGPTAPTTMADLSSRLQGWGTGVEEGDIMHVGMWYMVANFAFTNPLLPPSIPPSWVHASQRVSLTNNVSLSSAFPFVEFSTGRVGSFSRATLIKPASSLTDAVLGQDLFYYGIAIWFERPRNPQFSRYSRSKFAMESRLATLITSTTGDSPMARSIAESYQNI